jgi:hypothetical protein
MSIRAALASLRRRPGIVLVLAAMNLALALAATAPLSAQLAPLLDTRPLASEIVDGADDAPRAELLSDHPELVRATASTALLVLLVWGALSSAAAGGVLGAVRDGEPFAAACARHGWRMAKVGACGLLLRLPALVAPAGAWPLLDEARTFSQVVAFSAGPLFAGGALWSLGTVAIDRACGAALADPSLSAWRALRAGLGTSRRRFADTVVLATFSGGGFVLVTLAQFAAARALPPLAMALGVAGALLRATLTAATLLAAAA